MKEELQGKLVEILTSIQTATGKAADFAVEQLPDIAQSYITYGRVSWTFWSIVLVAIVGLLARSLYRNRSDVADGEPWTVLAIANVAIFGFIAIASVENALLAWLAPKVWLLKELAQLVK